MNLPANTFNIFKKNINNTFGSIKIGIWDYDVVQNKGDWSDNAYEIYGIDKRENPSFRTMYSIVHPQDKAVFLETCTDAIRNRKECNVEYRIIRRDGSIRKVTSYANIQRNENGKVVRITGTTVDITEHDFFNQQFVQRIDELSKNLDIGIWSKDIHTKKMEFCSASIEKITGYTSKNFTEDGVAWTDLVYNEDLKTYLNKLKRLNLNKKVNHEYRILHKNGEIKWIRDETLPVFDMGGALRRLNGIVTDVTSQKRAEERITYLVNHDYLTNLPNKRMFDEELYKLMHMVKDNQNLEEFAVMLLDLDGFKRINDSFGHTMGDKLLQMVAYRLQQCISNDEQAIVSRIGGDEFSLIIRNFVSCEQLDKMAQKIIAVLEEPFFIEKIELFITGSMGIARFDKLTDIEPTSLFKKGDIALQNAKSSGKNNYKVYNETMEKESLINYNLERDLKKAIKNKELFLHYQPKVDAKTAEIVGAEALIRWQHHKKGMISPGEFIPISEENGFIFELTDWTFREACKQLKVWEQMGLPVVPISVNISPRRFLKSNLVDVFFEIIKETEVNPELLELEITETAIIENDQIFVEYLKELKKLGIKISLDDFGTGYSSLIYLKKFLIDTVKIDQYFIKSYLTENTSPIAKYTIKLAHELNLTVVAEGVETNEQLEFLRQHNCDQIQGYLFSKPVIAEEFSQLLEKKYL
ncbi:sensor domain-containing protein [Solibacillus sp. FSL K6-1126]|uniref:sensor domain-containing protein n=1 Tax=Solibacillus sp. FSL K6-1126 TaxID=2921463 RepID=UPI0030F5D1FE